MTDLHAFSALRAPRRAQADQKPDDALLLLNWTEDLPAQGGAEATTITWGDAPLLSQLRVIAITQPRATAAREAAERFFIETLGAIDEKMLARPIDPNTGPPPEGDGVPNSFSGQAMLALFDRLDRWLVRKDNRPTAAQARPRLPAI